MPGRRGTREQHHPTDQPDENQMEHPYRHEPAILPAKQPSLQENQQVSNLRPVFGTPQGETPRAG